MPNTVETVEEPEVRQEFNRQLKLLLNRKMFNKRSSLLISSCLTMAGSLLLGGLGTTNRRCWA